jgi:hypothetical protein
VINSSSVIHAKDFIPEGFISKDSCGSPLPAKHLSGPVDDATDMRVTEKMGDPELETASNGNEDPDPEPISQDEGGHSCQFESVADGRWCYGLERAFTLLNEAGLATVDATDCRNACCDL